MKKNKKIIGIGYIIASVVLLFGVAMDFLKYGTGVIIIIIGLVIGSIITVINFFWEREAEKQIKSENKQLKKENEELKKTILK